MNLSDKIETALRNHILSGRELPYPLTLEGIAGYFKVSLMPVRMAVSSLVQQGLLKQGPNRRLSIAEITPDIDLTVDESDMLDASEVLARQIEDHVIQLSLFGNPDFLREEATAAQFGVGRTVVRRIFSQLSGSGTIEHVPRRGWRVRVFREKELRDYLQVRESLELLALRLTRGQLDKEHLREILEANLPDDAGRPQLDNRMHAYWIERSANRYLQDFFKSQGIYFQTLLDRAVFDEPMIASLAEEHRVTLQALIEDRFGDAEDALATHIRRQRVHVEKMFDRLNDLPHSSESVETTFSEPDE